MVSTKPLSRAARVSSARRWFSAKPTDQGSLPADPFVVRRGRRWGVQSDLAPSDAAQSTCQRQDRDGQGCLSHRSFLRNRVARDASSLSGRKGSSGASRRPCGRL
jgi:hypothetical protein